MPPSSAASHSLGAAVAPACVGTGTTSARSMTNAAMKPARFENVGPPIDTSMSRLRRVRGTQPVEIVSRLTLVETERRIRAGQHGGVHDHEVDPAVQAPDELLDAARVPPDEQQRDDGDDHQPDDEARARHCAVADAQEQSSAENPKDDVLRD